MHRIFQNFVDHLSSAQDPEALRDAMVEASAELHLSCFAYLSVPHRPGDAHRLGQKYHLQRQFERFDPVIIQALGHPEPFEWGLEIESFNYPS